MTIHAIRALIHFMVVMDVTKAMMANPQNLEVEQCIEWSTSIQDSPKRIRGFQSTSNKDVCIEKRTIVLKQHGNAMQHWLTDENGSCGRGIKLSVALVS
jgi:hypothetical protein